MDKVFSARLDTEVLRQMDRVATRLGMTKKQFLESAIRARAEQLEAAAERDVFAESLGAWERDESPGVTVVEARRAFRASMERRHSPRRKRSG